MSVGNWESSPISSGSSGAPPATPPPPLPKVGVGVVVLRHLLESPSPEVLLIKRGKRPSKGMWSFCGGKLELGETLIDCALREAIEETGVVLRHCGSHSFGATGNHEPTKGLFGRKQLDIPSVFAAVDVIEKDPDGSVAFHYAVVEVAAVPADYRSDPQPGDDADEARWFPTSELRSIEGLVPNAVEVVEEALERFEIPKK